jgi:hypothetical protein
MVTGCPYQVNRVSARFHFAIRSSENQGVDKPAKSNLKRKLVEPAEEHAIRCRAYELYEQRGRGDGHALDDWLRAEREIKGSRSWRISAPTK